MTTASTDQAIVHLVPHTHWDREWYEPFQVFRMRLVELIDQLLERMAADERLRFTLDGQAATVDDYLEVRPEAEPVIRRLIAEGRLAIGPWQILLDEFLVSGETIIRNLELGWARAEDLGGAMRVGYLPDMFGHVAQMPQILRRAGIERAVVWRGVPASIDRHTFTWLSPDGSAVETEYLVGGYGNGAYLFDVPALLGPKLAEYRELHADFYGDRSLLAMYGTDHAVPSPRLADLVDGVNRGGGDVEVRIQTLADYLERDGAPRLDPPPDDRPAWTGELRSGARANMLMNVVSARVDLKAAAALAERRLERGAEPLAALHGGEWPGRLLELAWRRVVDNSAHDSICGCSHDAVVAQVIGRYAEAEQIASGIVRTTLGRIAGSLPGGGWAVVNPSPFDRIDLVELDVAIPADWSSIAMRVGDRRVATQELGPNQRALGSFRLRGDQVAEFFRRRRHGRELFGRQINAVEIDPAADPASIVVIADDLPDPPELDVEALVDAIDDAVSAAPDGIWALDVRAADRRRVLARVSAPALGYAWIGESDGAGAEPEPSDAAVQVDDRRLANGLVEVRIASDGTFTLEGRGSRLEAVGTLVDGGDAGDSYNYGPPAEDHVVRVPADVTIRATVTGPLLGRVDIRRVFDWPRGLTPDIASRTDETVSTETLTILELRAGEPFVRVSVAVDNRSLDHRLRWHIPLPAPVTRSAAEGHFAIVERGLATEAGHGEVPLPTFPASAFVSVDGCTVLLDQVTEYEVVDGNELALTLLRSFGLISRNANPYREDPAGPEVSVPAAQLLGPRRFSFAIAPHAGTWTEGRALELAERYQHPLLAVRGTGPVLAPDGPTPAAIHGLRITGAGVGMTALRRRGDWLELRIVNRSDAPTTAAITPVASGPGTVTARSVDLLGRVGEALAVVRGNVELDLGPWEIRTVQYRRAAS